ncbi:MAG TPA: RagB/SusD family nutrient uptake outer membrane protein [Puia sp.]|nr:RagB/SusD family nutrient uptake outer membrane protein [Puia sp.]
MKNTSIILVVFLIALQIVACKKADFLNAKPDASLVVPSTVADFQALLDNDIIMNGAGNNGIVPGLSEVGANDYYLRNPYFNSSMDLISKNEYTWAENPYPGAYINDWEYPYRAILASNSALDGIQKILRTKDQQIAYDNVVGSALFYRAFNFYQVAQVFAPVYDSITANSDLGIPLRLSSDINEKIFRSTVKQTYLQIINDLKQATTLLPVNPTTGNRPGKPTAFALLARTYLSMQDYTNAYLYSDSCLQLYNLLIDYNFLDISQRLPIQRFNKENLLNAILIGAKPVLYNSIDSSLFNSYASNDLRPKIWFGTLANTPHLKCSYDGSGFPYGGIATDEIYLIRAECEARMGSYAAGMADLNNLLEKRFVTGTFIPYTAINSLDALSQILIERRKELLLRGLRWTDLRRLNKTPQYAQTILREENGTTYTLQPNDPRYVWLIPDPVIGFNPGMMQNPR